MTEPDRLAAEAAAEMKDDQNMNVVRRETTIVLADSGRELRCGIHNKPIVLTPEHGNRCEDCTPELVNGRTAEPYTARFCPACETWIYCADGPFAEGDPTKTMADCDHYEANHATAANYSAGASGVQVFGFPFMSFNHTVIFIPKADG